MNENEDAFIKAITSKEKNAKSKICTEKAGYCESLGNDLDDDDDNDQTESTQEDDYDIDSKDEL